jgi:hypothetical protein
MTQHNLGNALSVLGERNADINTLNWAKTAVGAAHEVFRQAGQVQRDTYFTASLAAIDETIRRLE